MPWQPLPLSYAIAVYPFQPSSSPAELPLQVGDQLYVIEQGGKNGAWCRGYLMAPPSLLLSLNPGSKAADARVFSGIFPRCCIEIREELGDDASVRTVTMDKPGAKPAAPVPMLKVGDESPSSSSEPLVDEISSCLREWYVSHLPELVLKRQYNVLDFMSTVTTKLDYARRELLNDVLTAHERERVQEEAVWDLVRGNKMLGAETTVRDPRQHGRLLTGEDSAIEVAKLQAIMSLLDEAPTEKFQQTSLHHCLMEIKSVEGTELDQASITVMLYQRDSEGVFRQFSESCTSIAADKLKTLFADLSKRDINEDGRLYLVIKVAISEQPRSALKSLGDRLSTQSGGSRGNKGSLADRKRSSLVFGSKRKQERQSAGSSGRTTSQSTYQAMSPSIPEEPMDDEEGSPKMVFNPVPRTIGVGVVDIASYIRASNSDFVEIPVRAPADNDEELAEAGSTILQQLMPSSAGQYTNCQRLSSVQIDLQPFQSPDADILIRTNPTSMHQISKTQKIGFAEAPAKPRSDIYLTLSRAEIFDGAQLSHPELGTVPLRTIVMPNLQLTMELRDSAGRRLEHCIFASSNSPSVTALRTQAVEVGQAWDQTICMRIPAGKVMETHLVLSVADAPEFPFALAWMPLWDNQLFLKNGKHSLALHAYDKTTSTFSQNGQGAYLSLPWDARKVTTTAGHDGLDVAVASLEVESLLCSTEFSQDPVLASLFNWRMLHSPRLMELLQKLFFVPEIEIVKQLNDVLNALFAILEHKSGSSKFEDTVFNNLIFVLGIVLDRRFNLGPVVERYADLHYNAPPIAMCLIRSWNRLLQSISEPQSSREMRALFKVGQPFLRLLMLSYERHRSGPDEEGRRLQHFKEDLKTIQIGLQMMMRNETAALVGNKTLLVQNFHTWLPELLRAYPAEEVIKYAINLVESCEEATGKLAMYKLILIQNYTRLEKIWDEPKHWKTLVRHCLHWLNPHWARPMVNTDEWREQIRLCCSIIAQLARRPIPILRDFLPSIVSTYCMLGSQAITRKRSLSLLFTSTYPFTTKPIQDEVYFDEVLLELAALLSTLSSFERPSDKNRTGPPSASNVHDTLNVTRSLLSGKLCPASWLSLQTHYHYSAIGILTSISDELTTSFLPDPEQSEEFDMELWKSFFETILVLIASPTLALESFSEQKRRAVWKIAGDVRQTGADLLRHCWGLLGWEATADDQRRYSVQRLGGFQVQYVPALVGPIIELCLSMHEGVRRVAVEILQTMIISEWGLNEDLDLIETEVVGALNSLLRPRDEPMVLSHNDTLTRKLFIGELLELFGTISKQPEDALWAALEELVATIEELIDLLSSGEGPEIPATPANHGSRHESRHESRHVSRNASRNGSRQQNHIVGTNGKRKPDVPDRSISRMEGKVYGKEALEVYKQLADEYEVSGDYKRLARTHRAMARIHEARAANQMAEDMQENMDLDEQDEEYDE